MPHSSYEWGTRVKSVEKQYAVAAAAVSGFDRLVRHEGTPLPHSLEALRASHRDINATERDLEATYLIRVWAVFEAALLSYHRSLKGDPNHRIRAKDLIDTVAGKRRGAAISNDLRDAVHEVREYRNSLVHEGDTEAAPVTIAAARRLLNTFLSKLPAHWG